MTPKEPQKQALERLLRELEEHRCARGEPCVEHHRAALPGVTSLLRDVPLVHGVNDIHKFRGAIETRSLLAGTELGRRALESESYFGLKNVVYTAAGFLYPDRRFAFVLSPDTESDRAVNASPWDSGSFYKSLCPHLPGPVDGSQRRELFLAYTLPAPEYRDYLIHYVATHFSSGEDYLASEIPIYADPLHAFCGSFTSRVFEVRFDDSIPIEGWSVDMIFVPRDGGDREGLKLRRILEPFSRRNRVQSYESTRRTLQDTVRGWIIGQMTKAGDRHARRFDSR